MPLTLDPNFGEPGRRYFRDFSPGDDFYQLLIDTHRDLTDEDRRHRRAARGAGAGARGHHRLTASPRR